MPERDWEKEAIQTVDQLIAEGHDMNSSGVCSASCKLCEPLRTTPEEQYKRIQELVTRKMEGPPRRRQAVLRFAVHRTELAALAQHPLVQDIQRTKNLGILVSVTLIFWSTDKRRATVHIRGLASIQGRREAYTPETLPEPMPWTERSSEGINPLDVGKKK
jgi:hypothetical protein